MPKQKQKKSSKLSQYVKDFPDFKTDGSVLFCKLCNKVVSSEKLFSIKQHLQSASHIEKQNSKSSQYNQQFIQEAINVNQNTSFNKELCEAFVAADIPLYKLRNPTLKSFLEKYMPYKVPCETTLRKSIDTIYSSTINEIKNWVKNRYVWISVDETTDAVGRYVANVVIGVLDCDGNLSSKRFLLNTALLEKANHHTIAMLFDESIKVLGDDFDKNKVLLLLTDAAPYMMKASQAIQIFYPKITHVTCVAHGLHRVCEKIRDLHPKVDHLIASVKKVFLECPARISFFKESAPDLPLPPQPVITRWGTWLDAVSYYAQHFEKVSPTLSVLNCQNSQALKTAKELFQNEVIRQEIIFINANYCFLTKSILKLETSSLLLSEQMEVVTDAEEKINTANLLAVREKFQHVFNRKNEGFQILKKLSKIIAGDINELNTSYSVAEISSFKFAPITSVVVERSFSMFKNVLRDNRHSFLFENLFKHFVIYCNENI